ncbi:MULTISPECIES: DUF7824 domain-containing protein [Streptomyces]|uniref:DUF7824 domain-containing protein n=1 Tax=Streptomyces nymphaeiformis TaxID=2663842 RepID=A0A7W7TYU1_9ACTN|nr:DUF6493 family protein [Streptomyces nymphaeiformis]MBB4981894.1 hypothetical protein [Streptomyces nymphaeiformis]
MTARAGGGGQGDARVEELLAAVRDGEAARMPGLLEPLDAAARKAALARLKELRAEVRAGKWATPPYHPNRIRSALYVAGAGCHPTAAAAASWLGARDLLIWEEDKVLALEVLGDRDPEWAADLAGRLAKRRTAAENSYPLLHGLMVRSGYRVPPTDGYVTGWAWHITDDRLVERLREDPQTPVLVAHALAMAEPPERLARSLGRRPERYWPFALRTLVEEGILDRAQILDVCVSRLLRGGPIRNLRLPLEMVRLLAPDAEELRQRIPDWVGIAAEAPSLVAGYAQDVLVELASAELLPVGALAEMTAGVLFRTEKKLVRAQLALVGKVLAREPGAAGELLPAVTEAFASEDTDVQERALKLVGRHLPAVDAEVRRELAEAAGLLGPTHRQAAEELFGADLEQEARLPYEEILPPVPEPQRLAPAATTVEELMAQLVVRRLAEEPAAFERALDGLVRHAHADRAAVAEAVREAFPRPRWEQEPHYFTHETHGVHVVLAGLLGVLDPALVDVRRTQGHGSVACLHQALSGVLDARLWEAAGLVGTAALPFLLATPTWHTGAIDPLVLVDRLREYRDAGVEPAPTDLAQALVRVLRADPSAERAAEEAAALGTEPGRRLAAWLRGEATAARAVQGAAADEPVPSATADEPVPSASGGGAVADAASVGATVRFLQRDEDRTLRRLWLADRLVVGIDEHPAVRAEFPPAFQWLGGALEATPRRCTHWIEGRAQWSTVLPADREVFAACLLPTLTSSTEGDSRGTTEPLTALVEAEGPVGRAVLLALAFGLGCVDADDRLRAVDAVLVLAARGELDARGLGAELAWLVAEGSVKPNRLADAARTAAATGAYGTVWAVLAAMLPELLAAAKPVRGLGEVLAVAADCVERCGAVGEVSGLGASASGRGSSQLVVQAKRLLGALRQGVDQPPTETV